MKTFDVRHTTVYRYANPVTFGEHQLMFRPRDSHDLRLIETELVISPPAGVRWLHDVFGNSIAVATFSDAAAELRFESRIRLEHYPLSQDIEYPIADHARSYPFSYSSDEAPDLARLLERHYADPEHRVDEWAKSFVRDDALPDTADLLARVTRTIKETLTYTVRQEEGTQTPVETLTSGAGSCRDYALLMMEAVRSLGFAARFVSGYLYDPAADGTVQGGGATHAWVQVYLPGAGWVEFDPTNGIVGGENLIRVAVVRDPSQAIPLSGSWTGAPADFLGMTVDVAVISAGLSA